MKIDIELYATLNIDPELAKTKLREAIQEAIDNLDLTFDGYVRVPETMSNEDYFESLNIANYNYPEDFYFETGGLIFVREGTPSKELKHVLTRVEDEE
jgi:hypothetical protein